MKTICAGRSFIVLSLSLFLLAGCLTPPSIDSASFGKPKSVTIVDIPKLKTRAVIGVYAPHAPGYPQFHFSERAGDFFDVAHDSSVSSLKSRAPVGLVEAIIFDIADSTQNKADLEFSGEILKLFPNYDLRSEFMLGLQEALIKRNIQINVINTGHNKAPRLRWPARDLEGNVYPSGALEEFPPADTDLLLQVSPIAFYNSPGPLNAYARNVTVGLALYDGRTKKFIGRETVRFKASDSRFEYHTYSGLVEDLPQAAPALREALLSLIPQIVDIVSARPRQ